LFRSLHRPVITPSFSFWWSDFQDCISREILTDLCERETSCEVIFSTLSCLEQLERIRDPRNSWIPFLGFQDRFSSLCRETGLGLIYSSPGKTQCWEWGYNLISSRMTLNHFWKRSTKFEWKECSCWAARCHSVSSSFSRLDVSSSDTQCHF
jgi:hypothetical protein